MKGTTAKKTRREGAMERRMKDAIKWDTKATSETNEYNAKSFKRLANLARTEVENIKRK